MDESLGNKVRLLVSVLTNPPRGKMALRLWEQVREIEAKRPKAAGSSRHQTQAEIDSMFDDLEWTTLDVPDDEASCEPAIETMTAAIVA